MIHITLTLACFTVLICSTEIFSDAKQIVRIKGRPRSRFEASLDAPEVVVEGTRNTGCPEPEGLQVYPDLSNCDKFYKCANGTLTYETCGNGLLFDSDKALSGAVHNFCSYNWVVNCGDRVYEDLPVSTPGCPYSFGIFPDGEGCSPDYVKCADGEAKRVSCDIGLVFDTRIRSCNYPDLLIAEQACNPSELLGGFQCPTSIDELKTDLAKRFFPFPRFPIKGHSDLYVICVNNQPRLQSCGVGKFEKESLGCIYESPF